ncbi:EscJ/YscJ/HrcJ family type III secretion inner membrane ring protein [Hahella sp. CCB-MM4]|uniref:type III secretion system inner membrane ring lipoprotein SctJ n=1 Tax=Hahella sp. (strain CCB-MM4) TaxID=1926491 RepID=UPI000B9A93C9|nr:type III secretion inner membrane ring lipoprotein SctJ [Hahella sp. CCB-MM4]OZG74394.1 EscJ/YscJ/HrcJ family type III secretion inner membrane ring protein [Hahella sp. CCB-MM4]
MEYRGRKTLIVALFCLLSLTGCEKSALYSSLTEQQANEVEAALLQVNINAVKVRAENGEDWAINVERDQLPQAMAVLREQGLPRFDSLSMGDIFRKEGFVSSPMEEKARYLYALSQELSATLMEIDGVVSARVHVALPQQGLLDEKKDSASVSVVIIQQPSVDLSIHETDIKAIITDGVEGVDDVNRVTVKFFTRNGYGNSMSAASQVTAQRSSKNVL